MVWPFSQRWPEKTAADVDSQTYDYVIVGGGTAACVLASRLSEDPSVSVLLISRGKIKDDWLLRLPMIGQALLKDAPQASVLYSEPDERWTGGKVHSMTSQAVGGATRINGLMLTRGAPGNYNKWAQLGNDDWSWAKCEPWFRKMENASLCHPRAAHRGQDGPLVVRHPPSPFLMDTYFEKAARDIGAYIGKDANDPKAPSTGFFHIDVMIHPIGHRLSALHAYLPISVTTERRDRLALCTGAVVTKLEFDQQGSTVTGARLVDNSSKRTARERVVKARREVIVCCGAIFSPQVLMLSGVGPRKELESHGIPIVHDLPGVGQNLKDHPSFGIAMEVLPADSYLILMRPLVIIWNLILWIIFKTGLLAAGTTRTALWAHTDVIDDETMEVLPSNDGDKRFDALLAENVPNIEVMFVGASFDEHYKKSRGYSGALATLTQPFSIGHIALASDDPLAYPKMYHPFITDERDWVVARKAARFTTHVLERARDTGYPFETVWHRAPGMKPGTVDGSWRDATDDDIDAFIRERLISTLHLTSTCRMAPKEDGGVVGQDLKVYGVNNLRVADASVFPTLTSGHTVAPTYLVAERCADFIKRDWAVLK